MKYLFVIVWFIPPLVFSGLPISDPFDATLRSPELPYNLIDTNPRCFSDGNCPMFPPGNKLSAFPNSEEKFQQILHNMFRMYPNSSRSAPIGRKQGGSTGSDTTYCSTSSCRHCGKTWHGIAPLYWYSDANQVARYKQWDYNTCNTSWYNAPESVGAHDTCKWGLANYSSTFRGVSYLTEIDRCAQFFGGSCRMGARVNAFCVDATYDDCDFESEGICGSSYCLKDSHCEPIFKKDYRYVGKGFVEGMNGVAAVYNSGGRVIDKLLPIAAHYDERYRVDSVKWRKDFRHFKLLLQFHDETSTRTPTACFALFNQQISKMYVYLSATPNDDGRFRQIQRLKFYNIDEHSVLFQAPFLPHTSCQPYAFVCKTTAGEVVRLPEDGDYYFGTEWMYWQNAKNHTALGYDECHENHYYHHPIEGWTVNGGPTINKSDIWYYQENSTCIGCSRIDVLDCLQQCIYDAPGTQIDADCQYNCTGVSLAPTLATTAPTQSPTQPSATPSTAPTIEGTSPPTASTQSPTQPTSQPTETTAHPTAPTSQPTAVTSHPTAPTAQPIIPSPHPTAPTTQPTTPTTQPTLPTQQPTLSTPHPTAPTHQPTAATSEPSAPTRPPTEITNQPTDPTRQPTIATLHPTASTQQPTPATSQPTASTTQPTESTTQPTIPTQQPTTLTPTEATLQPTMHTQQPTTLTPTEPTLQPTIPTPQPTTLTPTEATLQPTMPTQQPTTLTPTEATLQPTMPTPEPTAPTHQPTVPTRQPTVPTRSPSMATPEPTVPTQPPTLSTLQPTVSTSQPTEVTSQPTTPTAPPTSFTSQPTVVTSSPTQPTSPPTMPTSPHETSIPTAPTQQPTQPTQEPTVPTKQPTVSTSQPTVPTRHPTEVTSQPTLPTPSPTELTSQPTVSTSQPTVSTTQPTPTEATPTAPPSAPTRQPTETTQQPTRATSQPTASTNQPTSPTDQPTVPTPTPTPTVATPHPTDSTLNPTVSTQSPTAPTVTTPQPTDSTHDPTVSTQAPTQPTSQPTASTNQPTYPTSQPTHSTLHPTPQPTDSTLNPTPQPTDSTLTPTPQPTDSTVDPTAAPTNSTVNPTAAPTNAGNTCSSEDVWDNSWNSITAWNEAEDGAARLTLAQQKYLQTHQSCASWYGGDLEYFYYFNYNAGSSQLSVYMYICCPQGSTLGSSFTVPATVDNHNLYQANQAYTDEYGATLISKNEWTDPKQFGIKQYATFGVVGFILMICCVCVMYLVKRCKDKKKRRRPTLPNKSRDSKRNLAHTIQMHGLSAYPGPKHVQLPSQDRISTDGSTDGDNKYMSRFIKHKADSTDGSTDAGMGITLNPPPRFVGMHAVVPSVSFDTPELKARPSVDLAAPPKLSELRIAAVSVSADQAVDELDDQDIVDAFDLDL